MWVWFIRLQVPSTLLLRCHWKATIHAVVTARRCLKELNWKWFTLKFRKIQRTHLILTLWWPTSASMSWVFLLSWVTKSLCSQAGSSPSPRTWLGPHRWDITFRVNATVSSSSLFILETGLEGIGKSVDSSSPTLLCLAWRVKNPAQANEISETQYLNLLTFFFLPSSNLSSDFSTRFLPTDDTVTGPFFTLNLNQTLFLIKQLFCQLNYITYCTFSAWGDGVWADVLKINISCK